jgi:hypothetical protein
MLNANSQRIEAEYVALLGRAFTPSITSQSGSRMDGSGDPGRLEGL